MKGKAGFVIWFVWSLLFGPTDPLRRRPTRQTRQTNKLSAHHVFSLAHDHVRPPHPSPQSAARGADHARHHHRHRRRRGDGQLGAGRYRLRPSGNRQPGHQCDDHRPGRHDRRGRAGRTRLDFHAHGRRCGGYPDQSRECYDGDIRLAIRLAGHSREQELEHRRRRDDARIPRHPQLADCPGQLLHAVRYGFRRKSSRAGKDRGPESVRAG